MPIFLHYVFKISLLQVKQRYVAACSFLQLYFDYWRGEWKQSPLRHVHGHCSKVLDLHYNQPPRHVVLVLDGILAQNFKLYKAHVNKI